MKISWNGRPREGFRDHEELGIGRESRPFHGFGIDFEADAVSVPHEADHAPHAAEAPHVPHGEEGPAARLAQGQGEAARPLAQRALDIFARLRMPDQPAAADLLRRCDSGKEAGPKTGSTE